VIACQEVWGLLSNPVLLVKFGNVQFKNVLYQVVQLVFVGKYSPEIYDFVFV